ncbi:MAG: FxsA family protein [Angustibacter sp.]
MSPSLPRRRGRARGRRALTVLAVALLVVPIVEIAVIIAVGKAIGGWPTFLLLVAESALGAWLVRREGGRAWRGLREALATGRMPAGELADAALVLVGGTLLLTPGFVTDVAGFFFVLPVTRPIARRLLAGVVERRLLGASPWRASWSGRTTASGDAGADVIEGEVVEDDAPDDDPPGRGRR